MGNTIEADHPARESVHAGRRETLPDPARGFAGRGSARRRRRLPVVPWLLMMPTLISLGCITLYPILNGVWLSFTNTSLITNEDSFVGFANYATLLGNAQFWNAWQHTVYFMAVSTLLETVIGMAMALLLHEVFIGRSVVRAAMLVPWAMPTVVTSKMFGWLFDGQHGLINYILVHIGLLGGNLNWYGSARTALDTIIVADVWKTTPFMALLLLAGLQTIPNSLVEAARIDGGSAWSTFRHVRLPLLMPTLLIAGLFRALDAFRIFDLVYVLTGGGPADSTETLSTLSYKVLFSTLRFGYGSSLTMAMFVTEGLIAIGFCVVLIRQLRRVA